ncbi:SDR family NAD(P)-dependent oxidoreductase [Bizionia sp.]|uniref:SDR family NAD(P)-dependent oxidoreductase n=1 Tax=Bizionia sp. TaxID=1954480 RepID=UPI003A91AE41
MELLNAFSDLQNKVVVVTGGYGYLGESITNVLAKYGCKVYVLARSVEKFNEKFCQNKSVYFKQTDVSNISSIEKSIQAIGNKEGKIDVLINNAYYGVTNHPEKMTSQEWRKGIEGGVNQFFDCIKNAIPFLKKSENGKIINVSSMYGVVVPDLTIYDGREEFLNPPNYGTAKAAVIHLTKYYAMYLGKYNITVNSIAPGPFPSAEVQKDKEFIKRLQDKTKLKRIGNPEDLHGIVLLLASSSSNYITGQNISIDGGWTL